MIKPLPVIKYWQTHNSHLGIFIFFFKQNYIKVNGLGPRVQFPNMGPPALDLALENELCWASMTGVGQPWIIVCRVLSQQRWIIIAAPTSHVISAISNNLESHYLKDFHGFFYIYLWLKSTSIVIKNYLSPLSNSFKLGWLRLYIYIIILYLLNKDYQVL